MAELIIKFFQEQRELLVYFCEEIADIDYDESKNEEKYGVHFRSKWFSPRAIEPSRVLGKALTMQMTLKRRSSKMVIYTIAGIFLPRSS